MQEPSRVLACRYRSPVQVLACRSPVGSWRAGTGARSRSWHAGAQSGPACRNPIGSWRAGTGAAQPRSWSAGARSGPGVQEPGLDVFIYLSTGLPQSFLCCNRYHRTCVCEGVMEVDKRCCNQTQHTMYHHIFDRLNYLL